MLTRDKIKDRQKIRVQLHNITYVHRLFFQNNQNLNMGLVKYHLDSCNVTPNESMITLIGKYQNFPKLLTLEAHLLGKLILCLTQRVTTEIEP